MPVQAVLNAYPDWKIPGAVIAIVPTADRSKATVKVRVALTSKDSRIVPDMGVRVSFLEQKNENKPLTGFWVPNGAVLKDGNATYVFTITDGKAVRTAVTVAESNDSESRISKGVAKGDSLVATPDKDLKDGAKVVRKADAGQ